MPPRKPKYDSANQRVLQWNRFFEPGEEVPICIFPMPFHRFNDRVPHRHEFDELFIVTGGTAIHALEHEAFEMKRGDVFFIPKGREHQINCPEGTKMTLINVLFDFDRLRQDWSGLEEVDGFAGFFLKGASRRHHARQKVPHLRLGADELARVVSTVNSIEWELAKQQPGFGFFARAQLARLVGMLARYACHVPVESSRWSTRLAPVLSFMEEHLADPLSVGRLAQVAVMSESNLRKMFQTALKESPVHHLHRLRVEKSLEMLAENDRSITDIALKVGFNDGNYYNRVFRKIMGVSPSKYRDTTGFDHTEASRKPLPKRARSARRGQRFV